MATPFRHRNLYIVELFLVSEALLRSRVVVVAKQKNCRVPSSACHHHHLGYVTYTGPGPLAEGEDNMRVNWPEVLGARYPALRQKSARLREEFRETRDDLQREQTLVVVPSSVQDLAFYKNNILKRLSA